MAKPSTEVRVNLRMSFWSILKLWLMPRDFRRYAAVGVGVQYEYRWEMHGNTVEQRETMERLGLDGWLFLAFVNHWGPRDGRTMLFARRRRG